MGLIDDIKTCAQENGTKIQSSDAAEIEKLFNSLFYAKKNMDEEVKFVKQTDLSRHDTRYGKRHRRIQYKWEKHKIPLDRHCRPGSEIQHI